MKLELIILSKPLTENFFRVVDSAEYTKSGQNADIIKAIKIIDISFFTLTPLSTDLISSLGQFELKRDLPNYSFFGEIIIITKEKS